MADIQAIGIDAGSTTIKVVGVDGKGELVWHQLADTDPLLKAQIESMLQTAREAADGDQKIPIVATGYGRKLVDAADRAVTEITCHARGVFKRMGHGGTLVDIGGQDSKVVVITPKGKVANFAMNDKCAAGTGRFLEVVAQRLKHTMSDFSQAAIAASGEVAISSTCTVFAESEVVSLIAAGEDVSDIIKGLHRALVRRIAGLAHSTGVTEPVMLSGGVARSEAIRKYLSEEMGHEIIVPKDPQLMGAYGAALLALAPGTAPASSKLR